MADSPDDPPPDRSPSEKGSGDAPLPDDAPLETDEVPEEGATDAPDDAEATRISEYTTDNRTLDPSVRIVWGVRVLAAVTVVGLVAGFAATRLDIDPVLVVPAVGALAATGLAWVHLRYRAWSFRVREDALYLDRGVLTRVRTVAPHVRIQHVDTSRGPLERALGLSTLVVYTAGTRGADVSIPGLTTSEAAELQRHVKELAIAAEGGDAL